MKASWSRSVPLRIWILVGLAVVAAQAMVLLALGQPLICTCGHIKLWHGIVLSPENSQQLTDWYTPSHVIHGILFYAALSLLAPRLPIGLRFALALGIEATWEIVENTPMVIDRYREQALAQGYSGDSVINSACDSLAAAFGFLLAHRFPVAATVALVVGLELFVGFMIRDNLTLNIIQLLWPIEAIARWQAGG